MRSGSAAVGKTLASLLWLACLAAGLEAQTVNLISTNSTWSYFKGFSEASSPDTTAWRKRDFGDSSWATDPAPFYYGEQVPVGTVLGDMLNGYTTLFLRKAFVVTNAVDVAELELSAVCDDGFIAWINGTEVARYNVPNGDLAFNATASSAASEPVALQGYPIMEPETVLENGRNVLAIQVFNVSPGSSDIVFDAELTVTLRESVPPVVARVEPAPGIVTNLTQVTVTFSEPVTGVDAADLLINDMPASELSGSGAIYTFSFAQPEFGTVQVSWMMTCGIADLSSPPISFDPTGPESRWIYDLVDPSAPTVSSLNPPSGRTVRRLSQVEVLFDRPVTGVDAADLVVNGQPATGITGVAAGPYVLSFPAVADGQVKLAWAPNHGITDLAQEPHSFAGGTWSCTVDSQMPVPDVVISEFLAENNTGIGDEDGQEEDWIELHNRGKTDVNIEGWSLTDDPSEPGQWVFPAVSLPAGQYLLVFASGKDRKPTKPGGKLHTSFKLSITGEYLGLYNSESPREVVDELKPQYPEQRNDYSYGRDAYGRWRYYQSPTPWSANGLSGITNLISPVHFSVKRGFFAKPFNLLLSTETPGVGIFYTLNGSVPGPTNGLLYTNAIPITATRIVRAAAFLTNHLPSRVVTHTYLFGQPASRRILPALSLVTASNNLYGTRGIMEVSPRNTTKYGIAWERPVSAELIRPEDNGGFHVDCGIRVQGGGYVRGLYNYKTTELPYSKYSFRLYFRGDYGENELEYPLFPETPLHTFKTVVLRAGMNDSTNPYIRDELARALAADVGQVASHGTFVNLFLNGVYKGYYNPTERIDHHFLQDYHGGGAKWDMMAAMGEVREGDSVAWYALKNFALKNDLAVPTNYTRIESMMDTTNFVEYLLPLIYGDTDDWPHNNWRAARERAPGGLYRMYVWDAEWSFGFNNSANHNTIAAQLSSVNPPWGGTDIQQLFLRLKMSPEFRLMFADRVHKHFFNDGALTDARITARYSKLKAAVSGTISGFNNTIGSSWIPNRRRYLTNHFATARLLASSNAPVFSQFGGSVSKGLSLEMTAGAGTIYYTTNGADPRVRFTDQPAPDAIAFSSDAPLVLDRSMKVRARTLLETSWSAVTDASFQVEEFGSPLRISEMMYNPPGGDAYEFIEIVNTSMLTADLSGVSLSGVEFRFLEGVALAGGARLLLISDFNPVAFSKRYPGVVVAGQFGGSLSNGGERIELLDRHGRSIVSVDYNDSGLWPASADGGGHSIEIVDPLGDPDDPANWRASALPGGSPGQPSQIVPSSSVCLNEIEVAPSGPDIPRLELYNAGGATADLSGWSLSNDGDPRKFVFPTGTTLDAGGYLVLFCDLGGEGPALTTGFVLDPRGDRLFLYDPSTNRVDAISFGCQLEGYSIGRTADAGGKWRLTEPTWGSSNESAALASATNLVINEFLANALPGGDDWIELYNLSPDKPVALQGLFLGTSNALHQVTSLSFAPPQGFALFHADENPGPDHVDFKLPADRGAVVLYDSNGVELNRLTYRAQSEGVSMGRLPDGSDSQFTFAGSSSPGQPNYISSYSGPVLNEVMARNQAANADSSGRIADWIELHNPSPGRFDLTGMSLSVDAAKPGQWVFPPGLAIPGSGYLVVWCDATRPASVADEADLNMGRALSGEGGGVFLFNSMSQIVDSVEYGFQLRDLSFGRADGTWALLSAPTPGMPNAPRAELGDPASLRLNEWLAGSADGDDWLELYNLDTRPVNMAGLVLTDDPSLAGQTNHLVRALSFVGGRDCAKWIADGSPANGPDHLRFNLDAMGESLRIYAPDFSIIDNVDLDVQPRGASQGRFPDGQGAVVDFPATPTPGGNNFLPLPGVVINEVLAHTDLPLEDAIELLNLGPEPVDLSGWHLSDDARDWRKYRIPDGTILPARGYKVFYQGQFNANPGQPGSFALDSAYGGEVFLTATDAVGEPTGYRASAAFGPSENGVSAGRYQTSTGVDFVPLSQRTFGADNPATVDQFRKGSGLPNSYPRVGPVVFNEIMYHPGLTPLTNTVENPAEEYVELFNRSSATAFLYDPPNPTNTWRVRGGIDFDFPPDTIIPAGGYVLLVGFDPTADGEALANFRRKYGLDDTARVFGPYAGRLANDGERIELRKPDAPQPLGEPDAGFVPYVLVDRVEYTDHAPWPKMADGTGSSLQRLSADQYGNDPANWVAARPTAARANGSSALIDTDKDGLPDDWEWQFGLNLESPDGADGADGDPDGDGLTNLQEYNGGGNPRELTIMFLGASCTGGRLLVRFNGIAGNVYQLESRDLVNEGQWQPFGSVIPVLITQVAEVPVQLPAGTRTHFLRLVLVAQ